MKLINKKVKKLTPKNVENRLKIFIYFPEFLRLNNRNEKIFENIKYLILETEVADNLFKWHKGLMFSKKKVLLFDFHKTQFVSIHMFFVFFPIYAIVLERITKSEALHLVDSEIFDQGIQYFFKVKDLKFLKPFVSFYSCKTQYLLEIPVTFYTL